MLADPQHQLYVGGSGPQLVYIRTEIKDPVMLDRIIYEKLYGLLAQRDPALCCQFKGPALVKSFEGQLTILVC